ncbi:MAG: glycoside-pentoside-hexuronide (GPH):cation symporter [Erysipelotrichaceae bacterium]|jgi:sugar (glycoside-pentoside-hexuronide) transporter|nr:glycoside-pentoside-hexuronide (GPH):cation symporter [Erysipelotrichaceae bacterium]MDD6361724.1 glycoside-pentoside-hexuronide (GPH):cation symporter [Lachnospiraceae bacterium]MDD6578731.1 glycoside-pentoside-hexuronide (GPH):cation symporter [Lachnospiraceae bacterium]
MNEKIDSRTKWSYCIGATGRDAAYALVSMYLLVYVQYTVKLTTAQFAVISACMVACMVWDAINDPLMGIIIENTHFKWGKFKPWILMGSILNAIVIICLFTIRPSGWSFVVFYGLMYLAWGMTYTMNDISYWGLLPSLSSDAKTRDTLVTLMSIFICIGQFSVAGIVPTVVAGNAVQAYRVAALIVGLCLVGFQSLTAFGVKERERDDSAERVTLKKMFQIFLRNDQLTASGIAFFFFNVGQNLLLLFGVNFFYTEFGYSKGGNLVFWYTVMYGLGTLVSQALFSTLTSHFPKKKLMTFATVLLMVSYGLFLGYGYITPKNTILLNVIGFLIFFFQGLMNLIILVYVNNTIEYDEYRFHERHDSIISAVRSFAVKLAGGADQGLSALILICSGIYAISQKISNMEVAVNQGTMTKTEVLSQADGFLAGVSSIQQLMLRIGMVLVPVVTILIAYFLLAKKYRLDETEYDRIVKELERRQ